MTKLNQSIFEIEKLKTNLKEEHKTQHISFKNYFIFQKKVNQKITELEKKNIESKKKIDFLKNQIKELNFQKKIFENKISKLQNND